MTFSLPHLWLLPWWPTLPHCLAESASLAQRRVLDVIEIILQLLAILQHIKSCISPPASGGKHYICATRRNGTDDIDDGLLKETHGPGTGRGSLKSTVWVPQEPNKNISGYGCDRSLLTNFPKVGTQKKRVETSSLNSPRACQRRFKFRRERQ